MIELTRSNGSEPPFDVFPMTPPERPFFPSYIPFSRKFTRLECEDMVRIGRARPLLSGTVGNGKNHESHVDNDYRSVRLRPIDRVDDVFTIYLARIRDCVVWANDHHYGFDLTGLMEPLQFLEYHHDAEHPGKYNWHQDFGGGMWSWRKLSVVVNLSPPAQYAGCRLQLMTSGLVEPSQYQQGDLIVFPSWTVHRVTAIENGVRNALVGWFGGTPFR